MFSLELHPSIRQWQWEERIKSIGRNLPRVSLQWNRHTMLFLGTRIMEIKKKIRRNLPRNLQSHEIWIRGVFWSLRLPTTNLMTNMYKSNSPSCERGHTLPTLIHELWWRKFLFWPYCTHTPNVNQVPTETRARGKFLFSSFLKPPL